VVGFLERIHGARQIPQFQAWAGPHLDAPPYGYVTRVEDLKEITR